MTHTLAMLNYYTQMKQDLIKNVNTTTLDVNCTNLFYCENGDNCSQVSMCYKNATCSNINKCDQKTGKCKANLVCHNEGA